MSVNTLNTESKIVAFTGHRTYAGAANEQLRDIVTRLYERGARTFRVGMAEGFDLHAAEVVIALMGHHADIILEAYVPWPEFAARFRARERVRYDAIIREAAVVRYASFSYAHDVFHRRNDMLVDGATTLVAWYEHRRGGTEYTLRRAKRLGCQVLNLCEVGLFDTSI